MRSTPHQTTWEKFRKLKPTVLFVYHQPNGECNPLQVRCQEVFVLCQTADKEVWFCHAPFNIHVVRFCTKTPTVVVNDPKRLWHASANQFRYDMTQTKTCWVDFYLLARLATESDRQFVANPLFLLDAVMQPKTWYNQWSLSFQNLLAVWGLSKKWWPKVQQTNKITLEQGVCTTRDLYRIEREGIQMDVPYLNNCTEHLTHLWQNTKRELNHIYQRVFMTLQQRVFFSQRRYVKPVLKVNRHRLIRLLFQHIWNINLTENGEQQLQSVADNPLSNPSARQTARLIITGRRQLKFLNTYLLPWQQSISRDGHYHTFFNQTASVTGRITSNLQQVPRQPLCDANGKVVCDPRKIFKATANRSLVTFDHNQQELRIIANYTHKVGRPDVNLTRAFIPWPPDQANWTPTDLHTLLARKTFGEDVLNKPDFAYYRKLAKTTNFAMLYGAGWRTLAKILNTPHNVVALKLHDTFNQTYPGVHVYKGWVERTLRQKGQVQTLLHRCFTYHKPSAHLPSNHLVQGAGSELITTQLSKVMGLLKNTHSYVVNICHDEIIVDFHPVDVHLVPKVKMIMSETPADWVVPMVCEVKMSKHNWAEMRVWRD